jgi:hypothetical protein
LKAIKSINGLTPPIEPLSLVITKSDLYSDSTGRSAETGTLIQYPIRFGVYSLALEYQGNDAEIAAIESLISGNSLTVVFLDNGTYLTKQMYPSDRENTTEKIINGVGRHRLSFDLIEL